ncbi:tRNA 2-selenouridine(34) synthase MnmH [Chitinophagaceae bacterium MMS25-I14]
MPVIQTDIDTFLKLSERHSVLDVRSPGEYKQAHIPGAHSFPLFTDEERKIIGTTYKQVSRENAIKIGLDYFGPNMRKMVEEAEAIAAKQQDKTLLVHCWRGGMRSGAVAWLLDLYGFKVYQLKGGYKAYRNHIISHWTKDFPLTIIGGHTGSGKTRILDELKKSGQKVLDLENLAGHKGSAFGEVDGKEQPSQEMFENLLAMQLTQLTTLEPEKTIWTEDESQRIGDLNIPRDLWQMLRRKPVYFLEIPFEERLNYLVEEYGKMAREKIINATMRIQKRLGPLETKTAINCLLENDLRGCFCILLHYYDKQYNKALQNREPDVPLYKIECNTVHAAGNTRKILNHYRMNPGNKDTE